MTPGGANGRIGSNGELIMDEPMNDLEVEQQTDREKYEGSKPEHPDGWYRRYSRSGYAL
jgi:hypothetical protein